MLGKQKAQEVLTEALQYSQADETELILQGGKLFASRFANNYIYQNGVQKDYALTVRVAFGKKIGTATCNVFDGENLRQAIDDACLAAKHSQDDNEWISVLDKHTYSDFKKAYFEDTINYSPEDKAKMLAPVFESCEKENLLAAGMMTNGDSMTSVMNSNGIFAYHASTTSSLTFTARSESGAAGWAEFYSPDVREIEVASLTKMAIETAKMCENPVALEPGPYTVVLGPSAALSLIEFLMYLGFGGQSYSEKRTFTSGHLGEKLFDESFSLYDDPFQWEVLGLPFDLEGHPKSRLTLIEKGVLKNVAHDRKTSFLCQENNTGHALMPSGRYGPFPTNLLMSTGDSTLEEMIASTERGIFVNRFWYDNVVDEKKAITTGMSRDGTFLIENGKISKPVMNMRYNQSLLKAFANIEAIGKELKGFNSYFGKIAVASMKIKDFYFSGVSKE